ncbi:MAG: hypothetical protein ABIQ93_09165 [Saprospiraceae bacterium]
MKLTRNLNGHTAASSRLGAPYANQSENQSDAASVPEKSDMNRQAPHIIPISEEDAFRKFLLRRLPEVKAPASLRQKIRSSVKNFRP